MKKRYFFIHYIYYKLYRHAVWIERRGNPQKEPKPKIVGASLFLVLASLIYLSIAASFPEYPLLKIKNSSHGLILLGALVGIVYIIFARGRETEKIIDWFNREEFRKSNKKIVFDILFWIYTFYALSAFPVIIYLEMKARGDI